MFHRFAFENPDREEEFTVSKDLAVLLRVFSYKVTVYHAKEARPSEKRAFDKIK